MSDLVRISADTLRLWVTDLFTALGMPRDDAAISADALVEADLLGVSSHGVSNYIQMIYAPGLEQRWIKARPEIEVVRENATMALVDGDGGMGHVVGARAMEIAIAKAKESGLGLVTVRGSRHFGMAGYYSRMALAHDLIGFSATNADPLTVPTFGREARLGTNPIAFAVPTAEEPAFALDMATTTVPFGKIMLAARDGREIPIGWAADTSGRPTTDPRAALAARSLLPLGGTYEQGSHKGYGLAAVVDILAGILSGGPVGMAAAVTSGVGHCFGALDPSVLRPIEEIKAEMDAYLRMLRETASADPEEPVIFAGWKEHVHKQECLRDGIGLHPDVIAYLERLGEQLGVERPG